MTNQALCIGINYLGSGRPLGGCVNDAHLWAERLTSAGFAPRMLLEGDATRAAILAAMERALTDAGANGVCIITYAGHGSYRRDDNGDEPDGYDELWCPFDVDSGNVIADDEIHLLLSRFPDRRAVIINDSCFGGSIARVALALTLAPRNASARVRFLPPSEIAGSRAWRDQPRVAVAPAETTTVVAGCHDHQYTYEDGFVDPMTQQATVHGAFTHVASICLDLVGAGASYERWIQQVRFYLPSARFPQTPETTGPAGRIVFT